MRALTLNVGVLIGTLLLIFSARSEAVTKMARATFVVYCYDVGVSALNGKPGVISVQPGWSGAREVNWVIYDPQSVSISKIESWLREAGTYIDTLEANMSTEPGEETKQ
ncbi:MAG: hypothetical protein C0614_10140 [Desulfuromonas sp.]|nr:MAG: hypothetical protein C0614_10140 [Desulfuromonas sp.]